MLGLVEPYLASVIKPDYSDSVPKVYRSFVLAIIQATGSLDLIPHSTFLESSTNPSWFPDLTSHQETLH